MSTMIAALTPPNAAPPATVSGESGTGTGAGASSATARPARAVGRAGAAWEARSTWRVESGFQLTCRSRMETESTLDAVATRPGAWCEPTAAARTEPASLRPVLFRPSVGTVSCERVGCCERGDDGDSPVRPTCRCGVVGDDVGAAAAGVFVPVLELVLAEAWPVAIGTDEDATATVALAVFTTSTTGGGTDAAPAVFAALTVAAATVVETAWTVSATDVEAVADTGVVGAAGSDGATTAGTGAATVGVGTAAAGTKTAGAGGGVGAAGAAGRLGAAGAGAGAAGA